MRLRVLMALGCSLFVGCAPNYRARTYHEQMAHESPDMRQTVGVLRDLDQARLSELFVAATARPAYFSNPGLDPVSAPDVEQNKYICNSSFLIELLKAGANPSVLVRIGPRSGDEYVMERTGESAIGLGRLWSNCSVSTIEAVYASGRLDQPNGAYPLLPPAAESFQARLSRAEHMKNAESVRKYRRINAEDALALALVYSRSVRRESLERLLAAVLNLTKRSPDRDAAIEKIFEVWIARGGLYHADSDGYVSLLWNIASKGTPAMLEHLWYRAHRVSPNLINGELGTSKRPGLPRHPAGYFSSRGRNVLDSAISSKNVEMVAFLRGAGMKPTTKEGRQLEVEMQRESEAFRDRVQRERAAEAEATRLKREREVAAIDADKRRRANAMRDAARRAEAEPRVDPLWDAKPSFKPPAVSPRPTTSQSSPTKPAPGAGSVSPPPGVKPVPKKEPAPEWIEASPLPSVAVAGISRDTDTCVRFGFIEPIAFTVCKRAATNQARDNHSCYYKYENRGTRTLTLRWNLRLADGREVHERARARMDAGVSGVSSFSPAFCKVGVSGVLVRFKEL